jgi:hypothetical protein
MFARNNLFIEILEQIDVNFATLIDVMIVMIGIKFENKMIKL